MYPCTTCSQNVEHNPELFTAIADGINSKALPAWSYDAAIQYGCRLCPLAETNLN